MPAPSARQRNNRAFWQVTAFAMALVSLWVVAAYAPDVIEQVCAYAAAFGTLLWGIALLDRLGVWMGWTYDD